jgi:hypothetical protein
MWPAARLTAADRAAKARAMGLASQRPGLRRAETTTHHPDGRRIRARYGRWHPYLPGAAGKDGLVRAPACARQSEGLQLAGVEPYVTTMTIDDDGDDDGAGAGVGDDRACAAAAARSSPPQEVAARTRGAKARASGGEGRGDGGSGEVSGGGGRVLRSRRSGSAPQERGAAGGAAGRQREQVIVIDD